MPDDLYDRDILAWSQRQAGLLRRLAAGERVSDLDWPHVIDEVEDVGRSELRACQSLLTRSMEHLLKIQGWPKNTAVPHWRGEAVTFLREAQRAFSASMAQHLDLAGLFADARDAVREQRIDQTTPSSLPLTCPFTGPELLANRPDLDILLAKLAAARDD
jgi:hypothetical protein